jgi:hypothetical protein
LAEEMILKMDAMQMLALLLPLKAKQIEDMGRKDVWDHLSDLDKTLADLNLLRELGKTTFGNLLLNDRESLSHFIRTGCCMHKDLNCVKSRDKSMQEMWGRLGKTPLILLASKNNAAVLSAHGDGPGLTDAQKHAKEVSKHGGCHAAMLGGIICNNKDDKKGQHEKYKSWMYNETKEDLPYPDVSNTGYRSHGNAAGLFIVYQDYFIQFMEFIYAKKN